MLDYQLFKELIGLPEPWQVREVEVDMPSNRLDITLGYGKPKKSFFSWTRSEPKLTTVRHLPTMGMRTFLHIPRQALVDDPPLEVASAVKMTAVLQQWVQTAIKGANSFQSVTEVTGVVPGDARDISEKTGIWINRSSTGDEDKAVANMSVPGPAAMDREQSFSILASDVVPPETHKNWQLMISGDIPVSANTVALNMLLQRVRYQVLKDSSEINRLEGAKALRQYFIKNQHAHGDEIKLLSGETAVINTVQAIHKDEVRQNSVATPVVDGIPNENHAVWDGLLHGRIRLRTRDIGLQMMLERLSQSGAQNPDEQWQDNAKKLLRRFFQKHQRKLVTELLQLNLVPLEPLTAVDSGVVAVPDESHPCWNHLLVNKSITIDTQQVSLQMMLERVHMSLVKDPSESSRTVGVKLLRQYFIKHQQTHQAELNQLVAA